jgi:acyl-CoA thioesterase
MTSDTPAHTTVTDAVATTGGPFADLLGIELVEAGRGYCVMRMAVRPDMVNGAGVAHGAVVFALADTCSGAAAWTHRPGALAQSAQINWLRSAQAGDVLTATGREVALAGRSGTYDIAVTNQEGALVALFRGASRAGRARSLANQSREE